MKSLAASSIAQVVLTGCAEFRMHALFVAHMDNPTILLHAANMTADSSACYESARADEDGRNCVDQVLGTLLDWPFYGFFKRSLGVVAGLEDEGKLALTGDAVSWYFTDNSNKISAQ